MLTKDPEPAIGLQGLLWVTKTIIEDATELEPWLERSIGTTLLRPFVYLPLN